jgi:hypothetical protein
MASPRIRDAARAQSHAVTVSMLTQFERRRVWAAD